MRLAAESPASSVNQYRRVPFFNDRAGNADWLRIIALTSVNVLPGGWLSMASTKISSPSGCSATGKFASAVPPYSWVSRASALEKPAL